MTSHDHIFFDRILIANRGEIACRIISSCQRLGIQSIAVFSDADSDARHTRLADRAIHIGPAAATESYLDIAKILEAAQSTNAQAIHPGYGFLAENADFAQAVADAGMILIGPDPKSIEIMGSKALAKAIMAKANVPLVPGYHGKEQSDSNLIKQAQAIGYPLMLKAAAGGGGKGMRVVERPEELADALAAARREACSAFGDDRMILERYIQNPKHIEAQIFGDRHGQIVHLFERDCSSQRRHQKIIEEAPAPALDERVRQQLLNAAVDAARAVDYVGAGTVEFLVEGDEFYFLEMNTRLQVEHPVTELVTGQDLVEWQFLVAAGQPLPCKQEDIYCRGHAMEARIYAEDADSGFLPDSGRIQKLTFPDQDWVRIDSGVEVNDQVSIHYDPMIAKLIVSGQDRAHCLARLQFALAETHISGLTNNLGFLQLLASRPEFKQSTLDTGMIDRTLDHILDRNASVPVTVLAAAAVITLHDADHESVPARRSPWQISDGWRLGTSAPQRVRLEIGNQHFELDCLAANHGVVFDHDSETYKARLDPLTTSSASLELNGNRHQIIVHCGSAQQIDIIVDNRRWIVTRHRLFEQTQTSSTGDGRILAPMPGKVIQIAVQEGDAVSEGQTIALMEAMKMELSIKAEVSGTMQQVAILAGDLVEAETLLFEIDTGST